MRRVWLATAVFVGLGIVGGCRQEDAEGEPDADAGTSSSSSSSGGGSVDAGGDAKPTPEAPLGQVASGTTATLNGVWLSADHVFAVAVGETGTIVTSEDAGKTWNGSTSGVSTGLTAVWGASANDVWAVGEAGTILRTADRGFSWQPLSLGVPKPNLTAIWGSGSDQVFVGTAAGDIHRTRDMGTSFPIVMNAPALATEVVGIGGTSATDIWAARGYKMVHSTNGGDTWQEINTQNAYIQRGLWAGGPEDVYTINANGVVRRYDSTAGPEGTLHLTKLDSPLCFGCLELRGIAGVAPTDVWVVGDKGFAAHSTGHGDWREAPAGSANLRGVASVNDVVLAVGAGGTVMRR